MPSEPPDSPAGDLGTGWPVAPWRRAGTGAAAGVRGDLAPAGVPLYRTRSEAFDDLVLDAVEEIEQHWSVELAGVEFAIQDVPPDAEADAGRG